MVCCYYCEFEWMLSLKVNGFCCYVSEYIVSVNEFCSDFWGYWLFILDYYVVVGVDVVYFECVFGWGWLWWKYIF